MSSSASSNGADQVALTLVQLAEWAQRLGEPSGAKSLVTMVDDILSASLPNSMLPILDLSAASTVKKPLMVIHADGCTLKDLIACLRTNERNRTEDAGRPYVVPEIAKLFSKPVSNVPGKEGACLILSAWNDPATFREHRCMQSLMKVDVSDSFEVIGSKLRVCLPQDMFAALKDRMLNNRNAKIRSDVIPQMMGNAHLAVTVAFANEPDALKNDVRSAVVSRMSEWFIASVFSTLDGEPPAQPVPPPNPYSLLRRQVNPLSLMAAGLRDSLKASMVTNGAMTTTTDIAATGGTVANKPSDSRESLDLLRWAIQQNELRWPNQYTDVRSVLLAELGGQLDAGEEQVRVFLKSIDIDKRMLDRLEAEILELDTQRRRVDDEKRALMRSAALGTGSPSNAQVASVVAGSPSHAQVNAAQASSNAQTPLTSQAADSGNNMATRLHTLDEQLNSLDAERKRKEEERKTLKQVRVKNMRFVVNAMVHTSNLLETIDRNYLEAISIYEELLKIDEAEKVPYKEFANDLIFASCLYQIIYKRQNQLRYVQRARECLVQILHLREDRVKTHPQEFHWEYFTMASLSYILGEWDRAEEDYLFIIECIIPNTSPQKLAIDIAAVYRDLAKVLMHKLEFKKAAKYTLDAINFVLETKKVLINMEVAKYLAFLAKIHRSAHLHLEMMYSDAQRELDEMPDTAEQLRLLERMHMTSAAMAVNTRQNAALHRAAYLANADEYEDGGNEDDDDYEDADEQGTYGIMDDEDDADDIENDQYDRLTDSKPSTAKSSDVHKLEEERRFEDFEDVRHVTEEDGEGEDDGEQEDDEENDGEGTEIVERVSYSTTCSSYFRNLDYDLEKFPCGPHYPRQSSARSSGSQRHPYEDLLTRIAQLRDFNQEQWIVRTQDSAKVVRRLAEIELLNEQIQKLTLEYENGIEQGVFAAAVNSRGQNPVALRRALDHADLCHRIAGLHKQVGNTERSLEMYRAALEMKFQVVPPDSQIRSDLDDLAHEYCKHGRFDHAVYLFGKAVACFQELGEPELVAKALCNQATATERKGDYARAAALYEESLQRIQGPDRLPVVQKLFFCLSNGSEADRCVVYGKEILQSLDAESFESIKFRLLFSRVLVKANLLDDALRECQIASMLMSRAVPVDSPQFLQVLEALIITFVARQDWLSAEQTCRQALHILQTQKSFEQYRFTIENFVPLLMERAVLVAEEHADDAAEPILDEIIGYCEETLSVHMNMFPNPQKREQEFRARIHFNIGKAKFHKRLWIPAYDAYSDAFQIFTKVYDNDINHPVLASLSAEMDLVRDTIEAEQGDDDDDEDEMDYEDEEEMDESHADDTEPYDDDETNPPSSQEIIIARSSPGPQQQQQDMGSPFSSSPNTSYTNNRKHRAAREESTVTEDGIVVVARSAYPPGYVLPPSEDVNTSENDVVGSESPRKQQQQQQAHQTVETGENRTNNNADKASTSSRPRKRILSTIFSGVVGSRRHGGMMASPDSSAYVESSIFSQSATSPQHGQAGLVNGFVEPPVMPTKAKSVPVAPQPGGMMCCTFAKN